jgi:putative SOS response-associated peptidase YedK
MCYSAMVKRDIKALQKKFGPIALRSDEAQWYEEMHKKNPKVFPEVAERIFVGRFAPIVFHNDQGQLCCELMRYSAFPPNDIPEPSRYSTYNARRDNLKSSFWKSCYGKGHGVVLLSGFFEWVAVKDLLYAGHVTLAEVIAEFEKQAFERKSRLQASGKPWAPTKTELTDPRFRKTIIAFSPEAHEDLVAPVIFNSGEIEGVAVKGFAIVTDEPPPEVSAAGHDRCPALLSDAAWPQWLEPKGKTPKELDKLLGAQTKPRFVHALAS